MVLNYIASYGVFSVPFFAVLIYCTLGNIVAYIKNGMSSVLYVFAVMSLTVLWLLFFSALSGAGRIQISLVCAVAISIRGSNSRGLIEDD